MSRIEGAVSAGLLSFLTSARDTDWDVLYTAHLPRVYNFFRYRVGCTSDAEDLTATTFEKAWRARARYRRHLAGFTTWLLAIARNVAIDHLRQRRDHSPLDAAAHIPSPAESAEQKAVDRSDAEHLAGLLACVAAREREILALKYGAELTNREIARVTGLTESNVGTILHRTVQTLRHEWNRGHR